MPKSLSVKNSPPPTDRLTREEWLERTLEAIGWLGRGPSSIDELVAAVGMSKGSFYWHFENRADFVECFLNYWVDEYTAKIPGLVNAHGDSAEEKLLFLAESVTRLGVARYDVAMHAWALLEEKVAVAVEKAEAIRFDFVGSLFAGIGFKGRELEMRTRTFVTYYSFEPGLQAAISESARMAQVKLRHELLVRR